MDTNLKAFMKEEIKNRGTMEFPGIKKFCDSKGKPIPFILNCLPKKEIKNIRNLYKTKKVYRDKNGRPIVDNGNVVLLQDYDAEKAGLHIMVDCFVQPKLDDPELMEYYGILDRLDMPETIFCDNESFRYANQCVLEACGLVEKSDESKVIKDVKN